MKTSWHFPVVAALIVAAFLAGCGPRNVPPTGAPSPVASPTALQGGGAPAIPQTVSRSIQLDPATVEDADSLAVSSLVYDGLVRADANGNPQPALAISWMPSDDQLDYVMDLRQGVTFSSGALFNADAVLINFNRWFDPADPLHGNKAYPGWSEFFLGFKGEVDVQGVAVSPFDGIEKVDDYTVLIHLNRPDPELLSNLAQACFAILDPAVLASQGEAVGTTAASVSGTGAYVLSTWSDSGLVLTPNANYWGGVPADQLHIGWK
jgi:peptide/nickel transport system substrate-binding protein